MILKNFRIAVLTMEDWGIERLIREMFYQSGNTYLTPRLWDCANSLTRGVSHPPLHAAMELFALSSSPGRSLVAKHNSIVHEAGAPLAQPDAQKRIGQQSRSQRDVEIESRRAFAAGFPGHQAEDCPADANSDNG